MRLQKPGAPQAREAGGGLGRALPDPAATARGDIATCPLRPEARSLAQHWIRPGVRNTGCSASPSRRTWLGLRAEGHRLVETTAQKLPFECPLRLAYSRAP